VQRPLYTAMVVAIVLLAAGCGNHAQQTVQPATTSPSESGAAAADPVEEDADDGQMIVTYEDATTPEAQKGRALMQSTGVLDELAQDVTASFKLPYDIPLVGSQCDEANDFWSPSEHKLVMCYEDVNESLEIFGGAGDPNPEDTARRVAIASFFHELGHMSIDIYDLPATGREEDVADQLSAFELLAPDDDGNVDPDYVQAARDMAREYRIYAQRDGQPDRDLFADVHTLNAARMYNFECWIYGSDPDAGANAITDGLLTQDRADGCEDEYDKLTNAWNQLLAPHLK
jgi:Putative metallopeptidase